MKQFYTAAFAVLLTTAVTAQGLLPMANKTANQRRLEAYNTPTDVERDVIWSHDCDINSCSSWVFDNGSAIVGSPWEDIDLNFECTLEGPAGFYNQWAGGTGDGSAASPMNSTTAANGLLIVDSDLFGADANYSAAWIENSWVQTADPIDCSSLDFVSISLETRYRCWDAGVSDDSEKCLIEISRDGVNWPGIDTFGETEGTVDYGDGELVASRWEVFPGYETADGTDNPSLVEFDITSAAGGQEQIWVRFRWSGTWGYSWEIDDIQIYQTPANDLRIDNYLSYTDYFTTGVYEAGVFAAGQLTELQAAAKVHNVGYLDQEGSTLALDVNGAEVVASDPITIAYETDDTLRVVYDMAEVGAYDLTYNLSATNEDENPENNTAAQSFEVSNLHYGRDNGTMVAAFPAEGTDNFIALAPYNIFEDVTVYAIDVAIVAGSDDGTPVIAHLFDGADPNYITEQYGGLIASTAELDLAAQYSNDGTEGEVLWYTLVLEEPATLTAGSVIGAGFEHYGGSSVQIWESQYAYDNTCFVYGPFGAGDAYDWYYTNETPMVRLNLNPDAGNTVDAGCTDPIACNYNQTISEDDGSCEYESCAGCMDASACNFDSTVSIDDNESCFFPDEGQDCDGFCIDPAACNYAEEPNFVVPIYSENFESFNVGDYITSSGDWSTWAGGDGTAEDATVEADEAHESVNSLPIYSNSVTGGPMDVLLTVGLEGGIYEASFWMFIPETYSGYYNIQEDTAPGVGWAFDVTFASSGDFQVVADAVTVAVGSFPSGQWFEIHHLVDMDNDTVTLTIDGVTGNSFPFDSPFGGINFFSYGDGVSLPFYIVDDIEINSSNGIVPGACTYPGCQDPFASNYDSGAGCSADCNYLTYDCASIGDEAWVDEVMGLFPEWQDAMHGVAWEGEWVFNVPATVIEPGSGVSYGLHHVEWTEISGIPSWATTDYTLTDLEASSQHCIASSGTPTEPGMHEIIVSGEVFISVFGQPFSIGEQTFSAWLEVLENPNPIPGCTYPTALNYLAFASDDDGSCLFAGCTDEDAGNFNSLATIDDGSCCDDCDANTDSNCAADNDGDGVVTVSDLLILLGEFGTDCE